jgi:cell wall-associated NlpC family hydrolase
MADDPNPAPPAPTPAPVHPSPAPNPAPPAPKEPETFSREYVSELRNENKGLRLKATEEQQKREAAEAAATTAKTEAEAAAAAARAEAEETKTVAQKAADERIIRAELRTVAVKAGMVDLDGLKLADLSTVKLNDAGEVEGADDLMTKLKEAKPYLFGQAPSGTSNPNPPPNPSPPGAKPVKEMSKEEYQAAKKAALKG